MLRSAHVATVVEASRWTQKHGNHGPFVRLVRKDEAEARAAWVEMNVGAATEVSRRAAIDELSNGSGLQAVDASGSRATQSGCTWEVAVDKTAVPLPPFRLGAEWRCEKKKATAPSVMQKKTGQLVH